MHVWVGDLSAGEMTSRAEAITLCTRVITLVGALWILDGPVILSVLRYQQLSSRSVVCVYLSVDRNHTITLSVYYQNIKQWGGPCIIV